METRYVIVTPVRDEQAYLRFTIESVLGQTIRPQEWVIVNDGSKDATGNIIEEYTRQYPWIRAVHRENRGFRKNGSGVMEAFYDGYNAVNCRDWDFLAKLDGDLSFEPGYFERCFGHFERDPRLGIGGGFLSCFVNGEKKVEACPKFHVRGATKIYRSGCWKAIDGLRPVPGWDTIDEVKANMLGWSTRSFADAQMIHHRWTGAAEGSWANLVKNGRANYISGYHPLFVLAKCIARLFQRPYFVSSFGILYGFLSGYWQGIPQVDDSEMIRYLRGQQMNRLLGRETIWR
jgi:biofilm PGA synthesis N-glycosyltransferase PgaC